MKSTIIYPTPLKKGDRVCLIDPANSFTDEGIRVSLEMLTAQGLSVDVSEDIGFKRGTPAERAEKLNRIFRNPNYKAIFCVWGGYGTITLLDKLDYAAIAANRPAFIGFSDITAMHLAIQQRTGLVTFHGRTNCKDHPLSADVCNDLFSHLTDPQSEKHIVNLDNSPLTVLHPGDCSGILTGGNLSLISRLMGTPYEIDTEGKILFIEEVGEKPYRLHGMMMQLLLSGKLQAASGILLGQLVGCDDPGRPGSGLSSLMDVLDQVEVPVIGNVQAGHIYETLTLPLGKMCHFKDGNVILR